MASSRGKLRLHRRIIHVARIRNKHYFVLFGRPLKRLSANSRYLRLRDREFKLRRRLAASRVSAVSATEAAPSEPPDVAGGPYYLNPEQPDRLPLDELCGLLAAYDVISFDIFDTALYRSVESPDDVFRLLGGRVGMDDFSRIRKLAESHARLTNDRLEGLKEVTLSDIHTVLVNRHGADPAWLDMECALEIELSRPNPYIKEAFDRLRQVGKRIVFTSDTYLPLRTIEEMLARNGYRGYDRIYLSNEYRARKRDGDLQRLILADYGDTASVVHVGDVLESDVLRSQEVGLPAVHNADPRILAGRSDAGTMADSFYRAVIHNSLGSGVWQAGLHYTHGFRVGGILAVGFCEFIERLAAEKSIDRILFCGRGCDVLSRVYRASGGKVESSYVDTSGYAVSGITLDRYFDDYIGRSFFRWFSESDNTKPLALILADTGFDYLVDELESSDIERFLFPSSTNRPRLENFFWSHRSAIEEHNRASTEAATEYFRRAIGDAERVLIVDVGWSGTCIAGLRHFFRSALPDPVEVFGALMCTTRTEALSDAISEGFISPYVYSPLSNLDLAAVMMPEGNWPARTTDLLHLPLEYLFTAAVPTCVGYAFDEAGDPIAVRGNNMPRNVEQIEQLQQGIIDFAERYLEYSHGFADLRRVSPYVAFRPLQEAIRDRGYVREVYSDFRYDAAPALFGERVHRELFGDLFPVECSPSTPAEAEPAAETRSRTILFVSPEMTPSGTPQNLLQMCRTAISLGFKPIVWSAKAGPLIKEFEALGLLVQVVPRDKATPERVKTMIAGGLELAVCFSVMTDAYVRRLQKLVPLSWYVPESSNLPEFLRGAPVRTRTLRRSAAVCCVSDYAAAAVAKYADHPIEAVPNIADDVSELALPYQPRKGGLHRFIQFGTIEQREGYDLFVAAYKALPQEYRQRSELHFAGGFVEGGASFCSYLFGQIEDEPNIHYHGLIADVRTRVELLSQMDTVVVASRDEPLSSVALEGALLSKPLIVTANVGAKYLVDEGNGHVIESGSVDSLRTAFMRMIDAGEEALTAMGTESRRRYEDSASTAAYRRDLGAFFDRRIAAGVAGNLPARPTARTIVSAGSEPTPPKLTVSLTSFPARMSTVAPGIDSLLTQTRAPDRVILWLSADQFPGGE